MALFLSIGRDSPATRLRPDGNSELSHDTPEHLRIDNIFLIYPGFDSIHQKHVEDKFKSVKGSDFKFLKERVKRQYRRRF